MEWRLVTESQVKQMLDRDGLLSKTMSLLEKWRRDSKDSDKEMQACQKGIRRYLVRYYLNKEELQDFLKKWEASESRKELIEQVGLIHLEASNTDYIVNVNDRGLFLKEADLTKEAWSGIALELKDEWELAEFMSQYEG